MKATGKHLLVEYQGCSRSVLNQLKTIEQLMQAAARAANATIVNSVFHTFSPQGVSGVVVIEESHLSIHTWPEHGYAAVDFFTCGDCLPEKAHEVLLKGLGAENFEQMLIQRGELDESRAMNIIHHQQSRGDVSISYPGTAESSPESDDEATTLH